MAAEKRKMWIFRRPAAILVTSVALTGAAWGAGFSAALKGGLFLPTGDVFRDVYGSIFCLGPEGAVRISQKLEAWGGFELSGKSGFLSVSREETKLCITPVYAGVRYHLGQKDIHPYAGAAVACFFVQEENPLGKANQTAFGLIGRVGLLTRLKGAVWLDLSGSFRAASVSEDGDDPVEAKLDGFSISLGALYRF